MIRFWTTKDGKRILIQAMETSHIVNCLRMLERFAMAKRWHEIHCAYAFQSTLNGEMAIDSMDMEISRLEDSAWEEFLPPQYEALLSEIKRRNEWKGELSKHQMASFGLQAKLELRSSPFRLFRIGKGATMRIPSSEKPKSKL